MLELVLASVLELVLVSVSVSVSVLDRHKLILMIAPLPLPAQVLLVSFSIFPPLGYLFSIESNLFPLD